MLDHVMTVWLCSTISSVCQLAHCNHVGQAWHTSNDLLAGLSWAGLYWKLSGFMLCAGLPGLVYTTSLQSSDSIIGLVVYNLALLQDINNILILGILPCNETMIYQSNLDVINHMGLFICFSFNCGICPLTS